MLRNGLNAQPQAHITDKEMLRRLKDEADVLFRQKEELKRLQWLDKAVNNSYGQKNRHLNGYLEKSKSKSNQKHRKSKPKKEMVRKRLFVKEGEY